MKAQYDMFLGEEAPGEKHPAEHLSPVNAREFPAKQPAAPVMDEEQMVAHLAGTGRYRILRKLEPRPVATSFRPEFPLKAIILDTETTGLSHRKDEIIEIGAIAFTFNKQGEIGDVTGVYGGLQQPSVSIPSEITRLTGITDAMVAGRVIDIHTLRALIDPADLIIAHNAGFDRPKAKHAALEEARRLLRYRGGPLPRCARRP
ncbi:hypothetical protein HFO09_30425 [Rhizobium laguerreae]|nr:hypothetical protein [Rhizobium laguerreae]MBY3282024.1 hypothetical protein [Rhizobium laguerreae]MBY3293314.1 hypothetical protein [Rhizobium laguerreae]